MSFLQVLPLYVSGFSVVHFHIRYKRDGLLVLFWTDIGSQIKEILEPASAFTVPVSSHSQANNLLVEVSTVL